MVLVGASATKTEPLLAESQALEEGAAGAGASLAPPLPHRAAIAGDVEALRALPVEALWTRWARVGGALPIHLAAANGRLPVLDLLVSRMGSQDLGAGAYRGAPIDATDNSGRTPLMHAVAGKASEALVWLVRAGAATDVADLSGRCASHWAADQGSVGNFALLGNLGVDMDAPGPSGQRPLEIAVSKANLALVEYIILTRGCPDDARQAALAALQPGSCSFWLRRCLLKRVGCHERLPGEGYSVFGPAAGGCCGGPGGCCLLRRPCLGPEVVHTEARALSVCSGILCLLLAGALALLGPPAHPEAPKWQFLLCITSMVCTVAGSVCFCTAACRGPGEVDAQDKLRRQRYADALDVAASVVATDTLTDGLNHWHERGPLIHELCIVGPPRSKYCHAARVCVPVFDHYCGFLRNAVGRDNYASFFGTLVFAVPACSCLAVVAGATALNAAEPAITTILVLVALFYGALTFMWASVLLYHVILAVHGLTTHEMIQLHGGKGIPPQLVDANTGAFSNPYNRGLLRNWWYRVRPDRGRRGDAAEEAPFLLKTAAAASSGLV
eukprot:TRINITY_DN25056_c0_g1_i1.p1 TRINITY_DN25056_c0_g1~~TRINITY_DN25056_c0_g1_i1.p1  ORF type:complete len:592 (-),score=86.05 TRINITY_DN25056_c0_g1_i1:205-1875(-)